MPSFAELREVHEQLRISDSIRYRLVSGYKGRGFLMRKKKLIAWYEDKFLTCNAMVSLAGSGLFNDLWAIEAPANVAWPSGGKEGLFIDIYDWDTVILSNNKSSLEVSVLLCNGFFPCVLSIEGPGVIERRASGYVACLSSYGCSMLSVESALLMCEWTLSSSSLFVIEGSVLSLNHVEIQGCAASVDGGVVQCYGDQSNVKLTSSRLSGTWSSGSGGAISAVGCMVSVSNSTFDNCSSASGGGAITASQFVCFGSTVQLNTSVAIDSSTFKRCRSASVGGALLVASAFSRALVSNSHFSHCRSESSGGAIAATDKAAVNIYDTWFEENSAVNSGGGFALTTLAVGTVISSVFRGNAALGLGGGAISASESFLAMQSVLISGNTALQGGGGGIFWNGGISPNLNSVPSDTFCGPKTTNIAGFGNCLASSFARLALAKSPGVVYPGIPFQLTVLKLDSYNQTISTDSSSVVEAIAVANAELDADRYTSISGQYVATFTEGRAELSVVLKPSFVLVNQIDSRTILKSIPTIYFKGLDVQSDSTMLSSILKMSVAVDSSVCPSGFILALQSIQVGNDTSSRQGSCTECSPGTYSVSPLAGATSTSPSCLNCPPSGTCIGGSDVKFSIGSWVIRNGIYRLVGCPDGYQLVNSINGIFTHDVQNCLACSANSYILDSNVSNYSCQVCPIGAKCNGASLTGLVAGSVWVGDWETGVYVLESCPAGYYRQATTQDGQECILCPESYFCTGGSESSAQCPSGSFAPPGSNSSDACQSVVVVVVVVLLPVTRDQFAADEASFQDALAVAAGVQPGFVVISTITSTSHRSSLSESVEVDHDAIAPSLG